MISHKDITKSEFKEILDQYPSLIESIAESKPAKNGQKPLPELDRYRFVDAPDLFSGEAPKREMNKDDVKTLVEWKLRHGKHRPTLMNLISSNPPDLTSRTIQSAMKKYRHSSSTTSRAADALNILIQLKGVGPATASLLLAVHDPLKVIFFSDEAFYWLCKRGNPAKYNLGEYVELCEEAESLAERLGVSALEIEKVAYVLVKQQQQQQHKKKEDQEDESSMRIDGTKKPASSKLTGSGKRKATSSKDDIDGKKESKKRKEALDGGQIQDGPPVRRSQRLRK